MKQKLQKVISALLLSAVLIMGFSAPTYAVTIEPGQKSGSFEVPANNKSGIPLVNKTGHPINNLKLTASGTWNAGGETPSGIGPEGYPNWPGQKDFQYPDHPAFALVAQSKDRADDVRTVSVGTGLGFGNDEGYSFLMNDKPQYYGDNSGKVTVNWSVP